MTTTTWDGSSSTAWSTGANWDTNNKPTAADDTIINGSAPDDVVLSEPAACLSLNCTGFTHQLDAAHQPIEVSGSVTLGSGMTTNDLILALKESGTITPNGVHFDVLGFVGAAVKTVTLGGDTNVSMVDLNEPNTSLTFGANDLVLDTPDVDDRIGGFYVNSSATITYSAGAHIIYDIPDGLTGGQPGLYSPGSSTLPPIKISSDGDGVVTLESNIKTESLTLNSGTLNFDASDFETTGDCDITGGTVLASGRTLTVGGDLTVDGVAMSGFELDVTGTATISNAVVTNMTANGPVDCTIGCIDGGGNDANFEFPPAQTPVRWWQGSNPGQSGKDKSNKDKHKHK